jgi:hypothetical protein
MTKSLQKNKSFDFQQQSGFQTKDLARLCFKGL